MNQSIEKLPEKGEISPRPSQKKRRLAWIVFLSTQCFLFLFVAWSAWLINSEKGLHFLAFKLPAWFGVQVQAQQLKGTLWNGFSAEQIQIQTETSQLDLSRFQLDWQANELWHRHLEIKQILLGDVVIQTQATPPREKEATRFPQSLSLPLTVSIRQFEMGSVQYQETVWLNHLSARYFFDKTQHQLAISSLQTPWSQSEGQFKIAAKHPFQLAGQLQSEGELDQIHIQNQLKLDGSLEEIHLATHLSGQGVGLNADVAVSPFAPSLDEQIGRIWIRGQGINPQAFLSTLPKAKLDFDASILPVVQENLALNGEIQLHNASPLLLEQGGLPIQAIQGQFTIDEHGVIHSESIQTQWAKQGKINLAGDVDTSQKKLNLSATIAQLQTHDFSTAALSAQLNGTIKATGTFTEPQITWKLNTKEADSEGRVRFLSDTQQAQQTLILEKGEITPKKGGIMAFSGSLALFQEKELLLDVSSKKLNPRHIFPELPEGDINGTIQLKGKLTQATLQAKIQFQSSRLSGANLTGYGNIVYQNQHLKQLDTLIQLGQNQIYTRGSLGKKGDVLQLDISLPHLQQFGLGMTGLLKAKGKITHTANTWTDIEAHLEGQAQNLLIPHIVRIQELNFVSQFTPDIHRPIKLHADGKGITAADVNIEQIRTSLDGTLAQHRFQTQLDMRLANQALHFQTVAQGGLKENRAWHGVIQTLNLDGEVPIHLRNPVKLEASAERVVLGAAQWQLLGGQLNLEQLIWDKNQGLISKGRAEQIHLSMLHAFYTPPVEHNLVVGGDWDLAYGSAPRGHLHLKQQGGDVQLLIRSQPRRTQNLDLKGLILKSHFNQSGMHHHIEGQTRYGRVDGDIHLKSGLSNLSHAPLSGQIRVHNVELESFRSLLPLGNILNGTLHANMILGGSLAHPDLDGSIQGEKLYYRNHDVGVILANGSLSSRLKGQKWIVDALTFRNGGTVTLNGEVDLKDAVNPDVKAQIEFHRYLILNQPGRRLSVSGSGQSTYNQQGLGIRGGLKVEEGRFGRQAGTMPTLGEDVVVLGEEKKQVNSALPITMDLNLDLNDKVMFNWQGLDVVLGGKLQLRSQPQSTIQAVGSVHVQKGQYKAYGQNLVISKGVISFVGPLESPNLNIRAERKGSPVGAGVEVLGNLDMPRISLVANEPMSEKDKLSWLVLNRASSGSSGDEAALATAASAFLAGKLNDRIGLVDDFGLTSQQSRNAQTGEMNPAQQVLTFGKQLTQNLYIGYEAGLETASQSVKLIYQLSRSFQAILRAGTESSGGELRYTKRFD